MSRIAAVAILLVLAPLTTPLALGATPAPAAQTTTSAWQVSSDARTLYIVGTTQLLTKLDYPLPKPIDNAFSTSQGLLLEGDPGAESKAIAALLKRRGTLATGDALLDVLNPEQRKTFKQALEIVNVPLAKVNHLKPWLAALELTRAALGQLGITPEQGETRHFYDQAKKRGMPIVFLETVSEQIHLFDAMPEALQVQWLMLQAKGLNNLIEGRNEVVSAWRHGRVKELVKLIHGSLEGHPALYKALVTSRNDDWERVLQKKLEHKGADLFVLVGIGNLIGVDGLITRLRADGYSVVQL